MQSVDDPYDSEAVRDWIRLNSGPPGDRINWNDIATGLTLAGAGKDIDYEGISGAIDFDSNSEVTDTSFELWSVNSQGQIVVLEESAQNATDP